MFVPFLAAAAVAATFAQLGAMSVRLALLTGALYAVVLAAVLAAMFALWRKRMN